MTMVVMVDFSGAGGGRLRLVPVALVLFALVLFAFVLFAFVLFAFVLFAFVLFALVLFAFVLFAFVLFAFVLFAFVLFALMVVAFVLLALVLVVAVLVAVGTDDQPRRVRHGWPDSDHVRSRRVEMQVVVILNRPGQCGLGPDEAIAIEPAGPVMLVITSGE